MCNKVSCDWGEGGGGKGGRRGEEGGREGGGGGRGGEWEGEVQVNTTITRNSICYDK